MPTLCEVFCYLLILCYGILENSYSASLVTFCIARHVFYHVTENVKQCEFHWIMYELYDLSLPFLGIYVLHIY
jgi:hypothetical protein